MSRLNKNLQSKRKERKKAYVHVHPVPENNKNAHVLGFTRIIPFLPPCFVPVLHVPCGDEAHGR